jgi:AraC-like DNA-binding protein
MISKRSAPPAANASCSTPRSRCGRAARAWRRRRPACTRWPVIWRSASGHATRPSRGKWGPALLLEAWSPPTAPLRSQRRIDWPALAAWSRARWRSPLAVADLAAVACLSPAQFAQRCRDELGQSPMQWLRAQRLAHARQLRAAGFGVAEVARQVGYRSPSALTAALRRTALPRR